MRRRHFFGSVSPKPPNTFIGGVGSDYVTSALDLATLSPTLLESDIQNFQIDGDNNVSCYIEKKYNFLSNFINVASLTYYIDRDGWYNLDLTSSYRPFENCANLKYLYLPEEHRLYYSRYTNNANLIRYGLASATYSENTICNSHDIKLLYYPNMTSMGVSTTSYGFLSFLERAYMPLLSSLPKPISHFRPFINAKTGGKFYHNSALSATDRYAWGWVQKNGYTVGDVLTINGLDYTAVSGSPVNDGEFRVDGQTYQTQNQNLRNAINSDPRAGDIGVAGEVDAWYYVGDSQYVFLRSTTIGATANTIGIDDSGVSGGLTAKSGTTLQGGTDVHENLMYLRDTRGWTLVEVNNVIAVNAPTSLSASNQTATSVDLNFTAPTPNANGTDAYEVWVNDGTVYRYLFEYDEISASGDTLDLTDVFNNIGTISGITIKIRTIDGQMNFSDFSNEIILP